MCKSLGYMTAVRARAGTFQFLVVDLCENFIQTKVKK